MGTIRQKLSFLLVFTFLVNIMLPNISLASEVSNEINSKSAVANQISEDIKDKQSDTIEPYGVKGKVVSAACKTLAYAIRNGGSALSKLLSYLDEGAANVVNRYGGMIASELEYIARIPDLTANMVKSRLYLFLYEDLGLSAGVSLAIADAVKGTINWIIF